MDEKRLQIYTQAGKIAVEALHHAEKLIRSRKSSYYILCEKVEKLIKKRGGEPAFPCNVGVNEVTAHFSPFEEREGSIPSKGLVKVDVGVRIGGSIVDTASTVPLSSEFKDIVEANKAALEAAISSMSAGVKTGRIGAVVEAAAKARNYRTIRNLSGHQISEYSLHGKKSIPNIGRSLTPKIRAGEIYAVEPFFTFSDAYGEVVDTNMLRIYQLTKLKRPADRKQIRLYKQILKRFNRLPFSPRWLTDLMPLKEVLEILEAMRRRGIVSAFPVLVERSGRPVTQFEHTVLVREEGPLILTK